MPPRTTPPWRSGAHADAGPIWLDRAPHRRLLLRLLLPLCLLALCGLWLQYRQSDAAAGRDQRLVQLLPALAASVQRSDAPAPALALAAPVQDFLLRNAGLSGYSVRDLSGRLLHGQDWLHDGAAPPATQAPELRSVAFSGATYRVAVQRGNTGAGELVLALADASDPQQHRAQQLRAQLLAQLLLWLAAGLCIYWAVRRSLQPLAALARALERRAPCDLDPIALAPAAVPGELQALLHALNRLFALLRAQAEGQRRFVADATHQLRAPLASLQAQTEVWSLLARASAAARPGAPKPAGKTPQAQQEQAHGAVVLGADQIEQLRQSTRQTAQLAQRLLALASSDARSIVQAARPLNLKALCSELPAGLLDAASGKGVQLQQQLQAAQVIGHDWLLRELLVNVLDNAIRHSPPGAAVQLRCGPRTQRTGPPRACIEVEDEGPGIPASERARALLRYYRLPGASDAHPGPGLGLAIADEIARLHRARLTLDAGKQGRGLLVTLLFAP